MRLPELWDIDMAVRNARLYANRLYNTARNAYDYDNARDAERIASQGEAALRLLSSSWSEIKSMFAERDRAYDRYVTRDRECRSCHICAPCSYCTSKTEDEGDV